MQSTMKHVHESLERLGLSFIAQPKEAKTPYGVCVVDFGMDDAQNPVALQVLHYLAEREASPGHISAPQKLLSILAFVMTIPVVVPKERAEEVMRLIAHLNKGLPLGGINYSEIENSTYYTYSLPVFEKVPADEELLSVIHTALFVKDTFFAFVYEVASGEKTVAQLLEET